MSAGYKTAAWWYANVIAALLLVIGILLAAIIEWPLGVAAVVWPLGYVSGALVQHSLSSQPNL